MSDVLQNYDAKQISNYRKCYRFQKHMAKVRGIDWLFSFNTWLEVWHISGKLHLRGVRRGCYQMCRPGDVGPYSPDNVVIKTADENKTEAMGKKVVINGIPYDSISEAARTLRRTRDTIRKLSI
jgi:hypothetical protein